MKIKGRNIKFNILLFFTLLYPIMPSYFRLYGIIGQLFMMCMVFALLLFFNRFHYPIILDMKFNGLMGITYLWAAVFGLFSVIYGNTYGIITFVVPWMGIVPFFIREIKTKEQFIKIIDSLVVIALMVAILGLFEEITTVNVFSFLNSDNYIFDAGARLGYRRIYSFAAHPITYSLYCMFIEVVIFYRLTLPDTKRKKLLIVTYIIVFLSAICTFSRSSIILIILSQVVLLWLCGYRLFLRRMIEVIVFTILGVMFISFAVPSIGQIINSSMVLVLAVFSDSYATKLAAMGYQWNSKGVADRFILWKIVFEKMKGYYLLGHGPGATLTNTYVYNSLGNKIEKTSIEVQPLLILYRYGLLGMIMEELRNIQQLFISYKTMNRKASWEGKIGFNKACFVLFALYFVALFTVNQTDTIRIYMIISCVFISYNIHGKYECEQVL